MVFLYIFAFFSLIVCPLLYIRFVRFPNNKLVTLLILIINKFVGDLDVCVHVFYLLWRRVTYCVG
jgi:hypothetical protein